MQVALDETLRAEFGVEGAWWLAVRHRVRWCEVDAFAHANHTTYLEWDEDLRIRYMAACVLPFRIVTPGFVLPRTPVDCLMPLRLEARLRGTPRFIACRRT